MKYLFTILLMGFAFSQDYDVKIWGIPVGGAQIEYLSDNEVELNLRIREAVKPFYPVKINYYSEYNSDFSIKKAEKIAEQGNESFEYTIKYKDGVAIYDEKDSIEIPNETFSFLSLIEKLVQMPIDSVDTKWFNVENEGILYKARPLWNDSTNISIDNKEYFCDHYRLDLRIVDDTAKMFEETDYFNELFFDINSIRQLWVENWQKQRRLVKIAIRNSLINLEIVMAD